MRTLHLLFASTMGLAAAAQMAFAQLPVRESTPEEYILQWKEVAKRKMQEHGIPASITLAQGLLESRNGNSPLATEGNNHFGIKCTPDWSGDRMYHDDDRKNDCFRKYRDASECFEDHSRFLMRPRYASLFELKAGDYKGWAHGLKKCGYATDPRYPSKLIDLIERYDLHKFDEGIDVTYAGKGDSGPRSSGDRGKPAKRPRTDATGDNTVTIGGGREVFKFEDRIKYVKARQGETVNDIAAQLEQMPGWIAGWNDLARDQKLEEGQRIFIQPKRNKSKTADLCVVEEGETLWGISQRYGVKLKKLAQYNGIGIADPLTPGQQVWLRKPRK